MSFDSNSYRTTAIFAVIWRLAAELIRRHAHTNPLFVWQFHPGASQRGAIAIGRRRHPFARQEFPELIIYVGGSRPGAIERTDPNGLSMQLGNLLDRFLQNDTKETVDEMERHLDLTPTRGAAATTPAGLVCRLIAMFLERAVFARQSFRTTFGYVDTSAGAVLADWVAGDKPDLDTEAKCIKAFKRHGSYVLLHQCSFDGDPVTTFGELLSRAVIFDLTNSDALVVDPTGSLQRRRLIEDYQRLGNEPQPISRWLEGFVGVPTDKALPVLATRPRVTSAQQTAVLRPLVTRLRKMQPDHWWELKRAVWDNSEAATQHWASEFRWSAAKLLAALPEAERQALIDGFRDSHPRATATDDSVLSYFEDEVIDLLTKRASIAAYRTNDW